VVGAVVAEGGPLMVMDRERELEGEPVLDKGGVVPAQDEERGQNDWDVEDGILGDLPWESRLEDGIPLLEEVARRGPVVDLLGNEEMDNEEVRGWNAMNFVDLDGQASECSDEVLPMEGEVVDAVGGGVLPEVEVVDVEGGDGQGYVWNENLLPDGRNTDEVPWAEWYASCPTYGPIWQAVLTGMVWPPGFELVTVCNQEWKRRLIQDGKLCVPRAMLPYIVREHHESTYHIGQEHLLKEMRRFYRWGVTESVLKWLVNRMVSTCQICQAHKQPVKDYSVQMRSTLVPTSIGDHVFLDNFHMPEVKWEGVKYDCFVLAVDGFSGYTVIMPATRNGLSGAKVAKHMITRWCDLFGVPSNVTTDQGPQFLGAWWRTLCSMLGIRRAYSHAYRHQGNGKAERTGKELKDWLGRATDSGKRNWMEVLPSVQRLYHDTPGISGYSPYRLVFGRDRHLAGIPFSGSHGVDAEEWFENMRRVEDEVRSKVEGLRAKQVERWNKKRREPPVFVVGGKCWCLHPPDKSSELHGRWGGPYIIRCRTGEHSYKLWNGIREFGAYVANMKDNYDQGFGFQPVPLSYEKVSRRARLEVEEEDYEVDAILGHREIGRVMEFKTKWKGVPESEASWQPVNNFVMKYCVELVKYAKDHNLLDISVLRFLRTEEGVHEGLGAGGR